MELSELFNIANYTNEKGMLFNKDCMDLMKDIGGYDRPCTYRYSI